MTVIYIYIYSGICVWTDFSTFGCGFGHFTMETKQLLSEPVGALPELLDQRHPGSK